MFGLSYTCVLQLLCMHVLVCYGDPPTTTPMVELGVTDQPTTPHATASTSSRVDLLQRRRFMLHMIRRNFMREMGWNTLPTIDSSILERPPDLERFIQNLTMESRSCYSASCSLPEVIDRTMWDHPGDASMHLYFNVDTFPAGDVTTKNATLSLFAKPRSECGCSVGESTNVRLLVEVNQYLQALRPRRTNRHNRMRRPRMQNLDIDVLQWNDQRWIHFDVTDAVEDWMTRSRRRYGLEIKVERLQRVTPGRRITDFDAHEVFGQVDCSLPIDIACLGPNPLIMNNNLAPILEVWTETRPMMGLRKKRSVAESNRHYLEKRAKLLKQFDDEN